MILRKFALVALLAAPSFAVSAEEPSGEGFDLSTLTCWEVTTLPEDESAFVIALMIGYLQGEAGEVIMTPADIVAQVEALDASCVATPDEPAINTLK